MVAHLVVLLADSFWRRGTQRDNRNQASTIKRVVLNHNARAHCPYHLRRNRLPAFLEVDYDNPASFGRILHVSLGLGATTSYGLVVGATRSTTFRRRDFPVSSLAVDDRHAQARFSRRLTLRCGLLCACHSSYAICIRSHVSGDPRSAAARRIASPALTAALPFTTRDNATRGASSCFGNSVSVMPPSLRSTLSRNTSPGCGGLYIRAKCLFSVIVTIGASRSIGGSNH